MMDDLLVEYWDARTRLVKSFRKLNNKMKVVGVGDELKGFEMKKLCIIMDLRRMDRFFRRFMDKRKVYK